MSSERVQETRGAGNRSCVRCGHARNDHGSKGKCQLCRDCDFEGPTDD